jgi:hypothetical protein
MKKNLLIDVGSIVRTGEESKQLYVNLKCYTNDLVIIKYMDALELEKPDWFY